MMMSTWLWLLEEEQPDPSSSLSDQPHQYESILISSSSSRNASFASGQDVENEYVIVETPSISKSISSSNSTLFLTPSNTKKSSSPNIAMPTPDVPRRTGQRVVLAHDLMVDVSTKYVADIRRPSGVPTVGLVSVVTHKDGVRQEQPSITLHLENDDTEYSCYFVERNPKFVASISYPNQLAASDPATCPQTWVARNEVKKEAALKGEQARGNKAGATKIGRGSKDSLVTSRLIKMTSYENNPASEDDDNSSIEDKLSAGDSSPLHTVAARPLAFHELEHIYKTISGKRVALSEARSSEVNYNPDGTVNLNRFYLVKRPTTAEVQKYLRLGLEGQIDEKKFLLTANSTRRERGSMVISGEEILDGGYSNHLDEMETGAKSVELEKWLRGETLSSPTLDPNNNVTKKGGRHWKPDRRLVFDDFKERVCTLENGVTINPFFMNNMSSTDKDLDPSKRKKSCRRKRSFKANSRGEASCSNSARSNRKPCQVLVDALWEARHVASDHASEAGCAQCSGIAVTIGNTLGRASSLNSQDLADIEKGMDDCMVPTLSQVCQRHGIHGFTKKTASSRCSKSLKMTAYAAVVVIAVVFIVVSALALAIFFNLNPQMSFSAKNSSDS